MNPFLRNWSSLSELTRPNIQNQSITAAAYNLQYNCYADVRMTKYIYSLPGDALHAKPNPNQAAI
jgi:hypothetical protein